MGTSAEHEYREFVRHRLGELGAGFHPDTPFAEYVNGRGLRVYTRTIAKAWQSIQDTAFATLGPERVDAIALQEMRHHPNSSHLFSRRRGQ